MSYPKKIVKIKPAGYNPDQPDHDGKQWEVAKNMTSSAGKTMSVPGWAQVYANVFSDANNTNNIIALTNVEVSGVNFWVYHSPDESWVVTGNTHSNVTIANGWSSSMTDPSYWTSGVLNGIAFVNNRIDQPAYWDGNTSSDFVTFPDWDSGTRARRIIAHKNYWFALGIENSSGIFPEMVMWSDAAAPGAVPQSWTAAANTDAGSTILAETGGEIVTAKSMRDMLIIYKQSATYSCRYVGGNEIFAFDTLFTNKGALGTHSVADINGRHFVVGDGDIYITDGAQFQSISDGLVTSLLFGQLTANSVTQLFVIYKPATNSVQINFPSLGSADVDVALEYNLNDNTWGYRELNPMYPVTAAIGYVSDDDVSALWDDADTEWDTSNVFWNVRNFSTAASSIVYGSTQLYKGDFGTTKNGDTLSFNGIVTNIDFEDISRIKYVKALYPSIYGEPGSVVNFRVGSSSSVDGNVQWSSPVSYTLGTDHRVEVRTMGRLINIDVSSDDPILINNISIEADMRGYI